MIHAPQRPAVAVADLTVLLPDWRTRLRARNVAPSTIASYLRVGENLLEYLRMAGMPTTAGAIARDHLEAFLAALTERVSPATVAKHYRSMQQLFRWLVEDGEIPRSPVERMRPPAVPEQPVDILTDEELRALLDAAKGNTGENRRDTAMLRMLIDTGMRAGDRDGDPLTERQTFSGFLQARGLVREEETGLSLRKYLRGAMFGEWSGAEAERRAMTGATAADGGFLIPAPLAAEIIDLARAETRVFQAGARLVPMANRTLDVARWAEDPTPQWRAEGGAIAEDDAALDKVTLEAHSLAVVTKITRELLEDASGIEEQLRRAFALGFALKVDGAAMYGTGTGDEPTGLINTAGVTKSNVGANGGPPTLDVLVDSVGRVRDANEAPTAQIMADRTARSPAKLKADSQGTYLAPPSYLDGVRRLTTAQVPATLTTGTSNDTSDVFTGDFSQLYVGVRTALTITVLRERYMVEEGSFGLVGWYRGDIAVRGVRP